MKSRRVKEAAGWVILIGVFYAMTSFFLYSWRNPELTQMQVIQSWREALLGEWDNSD